MPGRPKPLKRNDLEELCNQGCDEPGCQCHEDTIYLNPKCHPGEGVEVCYEPGSGKLLVACQVCKGYIVEVAVSE
jgi:hypothetical protein